MAIPVSPIPVATNGKPPRRMPWIPFSLRFFAGFLALLLVFNVLVLWLPYYREQQLTRKIEGWGGHVETETDGHECIRKYVGKDRMKKVGVFDRIIGVHLEDTAINDAEIACLIGLTKLKWLNLRHTPVTDVGLAFLSRCPNLELLDLDQTSVTDAGLVHLSKLTSLRHLSLRNSALTDAGLANLSRLTSLQRLCLAKSAVTDNGLIHLCGLKNLRYLDVRVTDAVSDGVKELQKNSRSHCLIAKSST